MAASTLRGYAADIAKATGCTDASTLSEIEDIMRYIIFHSTLSWQTARQFNRGAREGYGLVLLERRAATQGAQPEDTEIAKMLRVRPEDVPTLRLSTQYR